MDLLERFRRRLDRVFSSRMFGAVLLGSAIGKVVEWILKLHVLGLDGGESMVLAWTGAAVAFLVAAVLWDPLERWLQGDDDPGGRGDP